MPSAKSKLDDIISKCESNNDLYEDHEFPASNCSLSLYKALPVIGNVFWLRAKEIAEKQNGATTKLWNMYKNSQISINSGTFGSSELVGALATVSQRPDLFDVIFDPKQLWPDQNDHHGMSKCQHYGVYLFKFWFNGVWQEVVVDDRLPVDQNFMPIFISSKDECNLLPSLLEKAYAKLLGSYEAISHCTLPEILHHFTGGAVESFDLYRSPPSFPFLTNSIFRALESRSLVGCCINVSNKTTGRGVFLSNGLLTCHQYIINDIREIKLVTERNEVPLTLVRVKNPWGKMKSWKGSWSAKSPEWRKLSKEDKEQMDLRINSDAEFWMDFSELLVLFDTLDLCNLPCSSNSCSSTSSSLSSTPPPASPDEGKSFKWNCQLFHGKWKSGVSAGGRPTCKETHWTNPQYRLTLKESDHDVGQSCVVIVELEQKDMTSVVHDEERKEIGFVIYKCHKGTHFPLDKEFFGSNNFTARCDHFTNLRFVVKRFIMEPGVYVVVPSTFQPNVEGSFVLRVMTSDIVNSLESSEDFTESLPRSSISSLHLDSVKDPKEEAIEKHFFDLASEDQQIGLHQMRSILNKELKLENQTKDFSLELCKHLVSLIDKNCKTRINLREMLYLWNVAKSWKKTFTSFDKSKQGSVSSHELRSLVLSMGYKFTPSVMSQLVHRYSNEQHSIELESFLVCMIRILNLHEIFKGKERNEKMICTLDEWLELSLSTL